MKYLFTLISARFEWIVGINVALQSLLHEMRSNEDREEEGTKGIGKNTLQE